MEFLGVGYQEILLILVLLLVVVGPERLPQMAYQMGKAVREMQKYARAVRDEFSDEMSYIEEQYRTVRGDIDEARTELREQSRSFDRELREQSDSLDREVKGATEEAETSLQLEEKPSQQASRKSGNVVPISSARSQPTSKQQKATGTTGKAATGTDSENATSGEESATGEEKPESGKTDRQDKPPLVF
ncbi:MAG: Sec-independent protein translocase protein TatB [Dehalococcoidia bacterium]|nr:Sec-independent protein translocase protein TatB [Dehalococcoidia bacterium]